MAIYVNGVLAASAQAVAPSVFDATAHLTVGINLGNVPYFQGTLDELRLYNRALSDSEVAGLP
jgi:arabinan endo-1,5-alpha-L-arabinosidase